MPRIVSVWLPRWPILRFLRNEARQSHSESHNRPKSEPVDPRRPFALADAADTASILAVNRAAEAEGLAPGARLADARARIGFLQVRTHDPEADANALARLAHWSTRYTPSVAPFDAANGADGLFLDITGAAHLLGGEEKLLADLARRLATFGLEARLACAETPGAAWAMARFSRTPSPIVTAGAEAEALAHLPVEALRLDAETALTLRRLGFKRIGALTGQHRAPFAARFEKALLKRLDQALGRAAEPLPLLAPPAVYLARRSLMEPIFNEDAIVEVANTLMGDLASTLERDGAGARALKLSLYRVDGLVEAIDLSLALPTRNPDHVTRLLKLRLHRIAQEVDAGYGFETLTLAVTVAEPMQAAQVEMAAGANTFEETAQLAALLDALRQRLGPRSVRRFEARARHIPERSEAIVAAAAQAAPWPSPRNTRPLLLFPHAEPADVIALLPDGPPQRITWRGRQHMIARAEGPERIAAEWWTMKAQAPTRDYYLVEDKAGRRLWLYREGIPGRETAAPRWFVHGLFA
ncbi:Y-family DNA polymerase [Hyphomicrobium sp.]|uniref:Y-family DNA polymerase n=1 Tax=Hyphomicrobium sp. TaxID=82 RepID=UPI003F714F95